MGIISEFLLPSIIQTFLTSLSQEAGTTQSMWVDRGMSLLDLIRPIIDQLYNSYPIRYHTCVVRNIVHVNTTSVHFVSKKCTHVTARSWTGWKKLVCVSVFVNIEHATQFNLCVHVGIFDEVWNILQIKRHFSSERLRIQIIMHVVSSLSINIV